MKLLVLNSGSSSLKFQLFLQKNFSVLASGLKEQIGDTESAAQLSFVDSSGDEKKLQLSDPVSDHRNAIKVMVAMLRESGMFTAAQGNQSAKLALGIFCYRLKKRVHPTKAYFVSWSAMIFNLKNS